MSHLVIFVVPFYKQSAAEFLLPMMGMDGVRTAIITQDPIYHFPARVQEKVPMVRVDEITDAGSLLTAANQIQKHFGKAHRILAINEQIQLPVAHARQSLEIDGMSVETIRNFRDKALMKERFREAGVPCARHVAVHDKETARKFVEEVGFPLCLKPIDGAAAQATFKVDSPETLEEILHASSPSAQRPVQLEEFVTGEESSFETLSVNGEHHWHSLTHYDPTPLNVVANPWIQWKILSPVDTDASRYDDIRKAGCDALTCLGMDTGLTHMGAALARPTIALFGSTCPYTDGARGPLKVMYEGLSCAPCRRRPSCDGAFTCLRLLTPERVLATAQSLLRGAEMS